MSLKTLKQGDTMKKFIFLMLIIVSLPIVFAENETINETVEITPEEEAEVNAFEEHWGATVRLLQLERAVMKNLLVGETVLDVITENHPDFNTTEAQSYLNQLKDLLEEVRDYEIPENPKGAAHEYVSFRKRAAEITRDFQKATQNILTVENKVQIKDALTLKEDLSEIDGQVRETIRNLHAERVQKMLENMGAEKPNLIMRIKNGSIGKEKINEELKQRFNEFAKEKKMEIVGRVKNANQQRINEIKQLQIEAKEKLNEVHHERLRVATALRVQRMINQTQNHLMNKAAILNRSNHTAAANRLAKASEIIGNRIGGGGR